MKPLTHVRYGKITFTFPNGATGAGLILPAQLPLIGEILNIHQINGLNTAAATAKITIEDKDGIVIFDGTAKAHNANYDHEFGVTIRRILSGDNTLKCTISGNPGASGYVVEVVVNIFGRDG